MNVKTDRRHDRRALSVDELRWLLDTTRQGPEWYGMTGPARGLLYRLAVESGLRAGELGSLTAGSFALAGPRPSVTIAAAYAKGRRQDVLPLRLDTADELRSVLVGKLPAAPVFNMPRGHEAKMFRADLADARAAWLKAAPSPQERQERAGSAFLSYADESGRVADFHALRHTTGSLLAASGAHPKVAQSIMRHSDVNLTLSRYSHVYAGQEAGAVAALPDLSAPTAQAAALKATGTDHNRAQEAAPEGLGSPRIDARVKIGPTPPTRRGLARWRGRRGRKARFALGVLLGAIGRFVAYFYGLR